MVLSSPRLGRDADFPLEPKKGSRKRQQGEEAGLQLQCLRGQESWHPCCALGWHRAPRFISPPIPWLSSGFSCAQGTSALAKIESGVQGGSDQLPLLPRTWPWSAWALLCGSQEAGSDTGGEALLGWPRRAEGDAELQTVMAEASADPTGARGWDGCRNHPELGRRGLGTCPATSRHRLPAERPADPPAKGESGRALLSAVSRHLGTVRPSPDRTSGPRRAAPTPVARTKPDAPRGGGAFTAMVKLFPPHPGHGSCPARSHARSPGFRTPQPLTGKLRELSWSPL